MGEGERKSSIYTYGLLSILYAKWKQKFIIWRKCRIRNFLVTGKGQELSGGNWNVKEGFEKFRQEENFPTCSRFRDSQKRPFAENFSVKTEY